MDVIGLLPNPEEVETFVADRSPNKRDRMIDSLLNREDDYAQHWLSFWNDLLRNAYSGPGYITGGRSQITEWLYSALRENKPYDQMVRELVSPPTPASEGFIGGIQWRGEVNASQTTQMQAAQNVSQALLGLNLKCASCHDSFVSNLTLKQAYSFAAVFSDSILEIERCEVPTGDVAEPGFIYRELGEIDGSLPTTERLAQLADILVDQRDGRLYRTISNRIWARLMGRGLIEPIDEMDVEPWSQELLDWLGADLIEHGSDLKHLISQVMRSRTYQLPAVAQSEEEASAEAFVFRGPLLKKMSAEQLVDAIGQVVAPVYTAVVFDPLRSPVAEATWIWYEYNDDGRNTFAPPGTYYFRHRFDLPEGRQIEDAELLITVDEAFKLSLNGAAIAQGRDWRQVQRIDVRQYVESRENILAIEARGGGRVGAPKPAGLLLSLKVDFTDGDSLKVISAAPDPDTDERAGSTSNVWKVTNEAPQPGWKAPAFDDSEWETVQGIESSAATGSNSTPLNWGQPIAFTHAPSTTRLRFARASLVQKDAFLTALGYPSREVVTTTRESEPTLIQALELSNGALLDQTIARGAERWLREYGRTPRELVERLYLTAFGRPPTAREARMATEFLGSVPTEETVQDLLWAILVQPDFQLIR